MKAKTPKAEAEQAPPETPPEPLPVTVRIGQELFAVAFNRADDMRPRNSIKWLIQQHDGISVGPANCVDISLVSIPEVLEKDGLITKLCDQGDVDQMWALLIKLRRQIMDKTVCTQDCINIARYIIPNV